MPIKPLKQEPLVVMYKSVVGMQAKDEFKREKTV